MELTTGCSDRWGQGSHSVLRATPGLRFGSHGGGMPGWSVERPARYRALLGCQGAPSLGLPAPPPPGLRPRRWPTCKVILGRVAGGGPQEVLGAPVLSKPVEFAALRASPPAYPQILTCAGKSVGFSRGRELRPGGCARGPRGDTPRSTSDGQTALPFASPELPGSTGGSLAGSSPMRALLIWPSSSDTWLPF